MDQIHLLSHEITEIFSATFSVLGFFVNLLTIFVVSRHDGLRKNGTTPFIINLSITNFIYSILVLPISVIRRITESWIFGETLCKIYPLFTFGNLTVCMMTMAAIALNRYCLFCKPHLYKVLFTPLKVSAMIIGIWLINTLQILPSILGIWGTTEIGADPTLCTIRSNSLGNPKAMLTIVNYLIVSVIITVCYILINRKVTKDNKLQNANEYYQISGELPLVKAMLGLFIGFSVCHLLVTFMVFSEFRYKMSNLYAIILLIYNAHCFISPFILFYTDKVYRQAYTQAFTSAQLIDQQKISNNLGEEPFIPYFNPCITQKKNRI